MDRVDGWVNAVGATYSTRAAEYIDLFGLIDAAHPADRQLVETWADGIDGAVLAGSHPQIREIK